MVDLAGLGGREVYRENLGCQPLDHNDAKNGAGFLIRVTVTRWTLSFRGVPCEPLWESRESAGLVRAVIGCLAAEKRLPVISGWVCTTKRKWAKR